MKLYKDKMSFVEYILESNMAAPKVLLFCLQAVLVITLGQGFALPGAFNSEAIITNNVVSNGNLFGTGVNPLASLSNVGVNEIVTTNNILSNNYGNALTGNYRNQPLIGGLSDIISTNNVLSANYGSLNGGSINEVVTTNNVLSTNFSPFSGGLTNGLTTLPNVGVSEIITSNNILSNNFAPSLSGMAVNPGLTYANGLSNKILGANLAPMSGLVNTEAFFPSNLLANSAQLLPLDNGGYITEIVPNLQVGDISLTGDLPIGGTIKVCGCIPVYGMIAVDGAVPSSGTAVVNTGGSFISQIVEPGCGCTNSIF